MGWGAGLRAYATHAHGNAGAASPTCALGNGRPRRRARRCRRASTARAGALDGPLRFRF